MNRFICPYPISMGWTDILFHAASLCGGACKNINFPFLEFWIRRRGGGKSRNENNCWKIQQFFQRTQNCSWNTHPRWQQLLCISTLKQLFPSLKEKNKEKREQSRTKTCKKRGVYQRLGVTLIVTKLRLVTAKLAETFLMSQHLTSNCIVAITQHLQNR